MAVIASLIYLAQQTRQNVRHSQALIQQGRAARIADTTLRLAELRESDAIDRCFEGSLEVNAKDVARFLFLCRAIFVSAEDSFFQHQQGLLDETAFESFESSIKSGMGAAGIAAAWLMTANMYEPQFRDYMNRMMGDLKAPSVRARRGLESWKDAIATVSREEAR
ncbi:MAG TPA: hypothetical protein VHU87_04090 [Rhizomicrobium sp.]|nr:hypothetical protein [Rhizomicrobium sp.]